MDDRYLWDRSGDPDPEIERLEEWLGRYRYTGSEPPDVATVRRDRRRRLLRVAVAWAALPAAAVLVFVAIGLVRSMRGVGGDGDGGDDGGAADASWPIRWAEVDGAPSSAAEAAALGPGASIETGADETAILRIAELGTVQVGPGSRVRRVVVDGGASGSGSGSGSGRGEQQRLALAFGRIRASIQAPPRVFVVETPSAEAVDLGCAYVLEIDPAGDGRLDVTEGQVALEVDGPASGVLVPSGASCSIRDGIGPGVPVFRDTDAEFARAIEALEYTLVSSTRHREREASFDATFAEAVEATVEGLLGILLASEHYPDTLSLFHLAVGAGRLPSLDRARRARVLDRLFELVPTAAALDRGRLLDGDPRARSELAEYLRAFW